MKARLPIINIIELDEKGVDRDVNSICSVKSGNVLLFDLGKRARFEFLKIIRYINEKKKA